MSVIDEHKVKRENLPHARNEFPCCGDVFRTFTKHNRHPEMRFDPDWTMVECDSCGAVITVGDYWGHDVLDADRALWVGQGRDL